MVVYSIYPPDLKVPACAYDCTFIGADGTVTDYRGNQIDIIPEAQVSVSCTAA